MLYRKTNVAEAFLRAASTSRSGANHPLARDIRHALKLNERQYSTAVRDTWPVKEEKK